MRAVDVSEVDVWIGTAMYSEHMQIRIMQGIQDVKK